MDKRTKNILIIASIVLALILGIYFVGRFSGKKKARDERPDLADQPNNGTDVPDPSSWNPMTLASKLHSVMKGLLGSPVKKEETFGELANLATDGMVVAVYNAFNSKYSQGKEDTLTSWINDEVFVGDLWNLGNLAIDNKELALNRLAKLNLH